MMRAVAIGLLLALTLAHQDVWFWDNPHLVFGFLPIGLAWHAGISLSAVGVWWLISRHAWPKSRFSEESP